MTAVTESLLLGQLHKILVTMGTRSLLQGRLNQELPFLKAPLAHSRGLHLLLFIRSRTRDLR